MEEEHTHHLATMYRHMKKHVVQHGFQGEIEWQASLSLEKVSESDFLRESAWVVLASGFRESVLRHKFGSISDAFLNWSSAQDIAEHNDTCRENALAVFRNERKIDAIVTIAERVAGEGFESIRGRIGQDGIPFLLELPYIGPITAFHLAKNLGVPAVKPDRHLVRITKAAGYASPEDLCQEISILTGDSISVIDLVMWRYATLNPAYETDVVAAR